MSAAGLGYVTRLSAARRVDSRQVAFGGVESGNAGLAESELVRTRLERALGLCRIFLANLSQD